MGKFLRVLLLANTVLWVYFWLSFAHAAYAYKPNPLGHLSGTGFTFWGRSIALTESGLVYSFFKITYYINYLSFEVTFRLFRFFDPHHASPRFVLGISEGGWYLLSTMGLSFVQWLLVAYASEKLWRLFKTDKATTNDRGRAGGAG